MVQEITNIIGLPLLRDEGNEKVRKLEFDTGIVSTYDSDEKSNRVHSELLDKYNSKLPQLKKIPGFHFITAGNGYRNNTYTINVYVDPVSA